MTIPKQRNPEWPTNPIAGAPHDRRHARFSLDVVAGPDRGLHVLSSGGTMGTPKGVVGLHRHYIAAGLQLHEWTKSATKPWTDVIFLPLPMFRISNDFVVPKIIARIASATSAT